MFLPRVEDFVPASSVEDIESPRGTETILLVDDEFEVRALIRLALSAFGYEVLDASDGASALCSSGAKEPIQLLSPTW